MSKSIAIIGTGASGCLCAYFLLKNIIQSKPSLSWEGASVTLFDKGAPLRTLLPTGGGRCNLAHAEFDFKELAKNYPRGEKFLYSIFSKFATSETLDTFEKMGIKCYAQENGRIFPESNSAKEVRETILKNIQKANFIKEEVVEIKPIDGGFKVKTVKSPTPQSPHSKGEEVNQYFFTDVVLAIGGHSGLELIRRLNIKIVEPKPSLVGLNTEENFKDLSGIAVKGVGRTIRLYPNSIGKKYPTRVEIRLLERAIPDRDPSGTTVYYEEVIA